MKPTSRVAKTLTVAATSTNKAARTRNTKHPSGTLVSGKLPLDRILALLGDGLKAADRALATAFVQAFYQRLDGEEHTRHSDAQWAAMGAAMFSLARERKPGQVKLVVSNPADAGHTLIQLVHPDMPYLVDTLSLNLAARGIGVQLLGHPVLQLQRDKAGRLQQVGRGSSESIMLVLADRLRPAQVEELQQGLEQALEQLRAAAADAAAMRQRALQVAAAIDSASHGGQVAAESAAFLQWAADNQFVFLGSRHYQVQGKGAKARLVADKGSGLGLMRGEPRAAARPVAGLAAQGLHQAGGLDAPVIVTKTNARSQIHRGGYMDYIGVLSFDQAGDITGETRFVGLFADSAWGVRPWDVPLVRQRATAVLQRSGLDPSGHSGKALRHILETLPRVELFQSTEDELYTTAMGLLGLRERAGTRLFVRRDRFSRFDSVLVYLPRERFNTDLRLRIEAMLREALHGEFVDSTVVLGESPLAQLHLIVRSADKAAAGVDVAALNRQLGELLRNFHDELRECLVEICGETLGLNLAEGYGRALPAGYIADSSAQSAADDVCELAQLDEQQSLRLRLHARPGDGSLRLKLYRRGEDLPLSDVLPMMENLGLRVMAERPYKVQVDGQLHYIQDFEVEAAGAAIDPEPVNTVFAQAFVRTWRGEVENDGFNRLVLAAGMDWRQVGMLRAYCKYLLQAGIPFSQSYIEATLLRYPLLAALLEQYFQARFDPALEGKRGSRAPGQLPLALLQLAGSDEQAAAALETVARATDRQSRCQALRQALHGQLDKVSSLDEDRIVRAYISVIDATLRTSYHRPYADGLRADGGPADYVSFKLDPAGVPDLPKPRPYREIFVYGPRVEGVHLRFGPVARGGLRWSDRREDFRTEVLGLVKAQMVKNTVIVPVGSKGGFVAKQLPDPAVDRDAWFAEGVACYKRFINGLLDITDNIVDGVIVPPPGVVRHDGDDPYLVVAADKGTATFSDTANGIARAHGFWLDDAFASGGSVGYDHKGMGITARGGWESVKRHFRALGIDCQAEDFTAVGIGDMSGDVFGNGMLLSPHIRLVCAFDHRHIFLDPNPDAASSFAERQRLFALPRSSWADYDATLISKGGGVYPRSLKSITITPQVRQALGLGEEVTSLTPTELISAALTAPVDLLWNGGIGTYIKASSETHADVGDRANNALRVNGGQLRCRIVGEGGNLGMTQLGRIEAAQNGVLLNTDFIDNSAGVDTSDHEVNIKILLNDVVAAGKLTVAQRNKLLAAMTAEVGELVLMDNYRQNQAISLMERLSRRRLGSKQHFIRVLEQAGQLDRAIEFLPSDAELSQRKARGQGMTRPELAVLLSYSKLVAFGQLLDSDIPEDPYLSKELQRYFPKPLQDKYAGFMDGHRLKREIIATAVTNQTINRMGATFLMRMVEDTGRSVAEVAKAYTISRETLDARALWAQIDALDGQLPESVQVDALEVIWKLQRSFVRWLLQRPGPIPAITAAVQRYQGAFEQIRTASGVLPDSQRDGYQTRVQGFKDKGLPGGLAQQLAELAYLEPAFDIIELAIARKARPVEVSKVHFRLGEALGLPWLFEQIDALEVNGRWHAIARGVLRDELAAHQRVLAGQVLGMKGRDAAARVAAWLAREDSALRFTRAMLAELAEQKSLDYPTVSVAVQRLGQLAAHAR